MATLSIQLKGLEALKAQMNPNRIKKEIAIGAGQVALLIHSDLKYYLQGRYTNLPSLDTVWINKSSSVREIGKSVLKAQLAYQQKGINLAKFMDAQPFLGNIPPLPKKRQGWVHTVEIIRGRKKIVYGKRGFGGFTPRDSKGTLVRRNGKAIMFERIGKGRYPVKPLYGPALTDLLLARLTSKEFTTVLNKAEQILSESVFK